MLTIELTRTKMSEELEKTLNTNKYNNKDNFPAQC